MAVAFSNVQISSSSSFSATRKKRKKEKGPFQRPRKQKQTKRGGGGKNRRSQSGFLSCIALYKAVCHTPLSYRDTEEKRRLFFATATAGSASSVLRRPLKALDCRTGSGLPHKRAVHAFASHTDTRDGTQMKKRGKPATPHERPDQKFTRLRSDPPDTARNAPSRKEKEKENKYRFRLRRI